MRTRMLLVLAALVAGLTVVPASAPSAGAQDSHRYALITFHKNYRDTSRSRLTWQVFAVRGGRRSTLAHSQWRAGSGYFRDSTDACAKNRGWLPDGGYLPRLFRDYHGSFIKGRAIYLGQKACADGTTRTDLFIHTEQGAGSRQCPDRPGDQVCRWEHPRIKDYRSYGCIKLSPRDLHELYDAWRRYFPLGSSDHVRMRVR